MLLLQAPIPPKYAPAPWYLRWLETMPVYVVVGMAALVFVVWLLETPIKKLFELNLGHARRSRIG